MFASKLKELRKAKGITQEIFADEFNISRGTIAMWETGKREPAHETLLKLADYFNVSVDYLLGREEEPEFINFRLPWKNSIVVFDNSGDKYEFPFKKEDLQHIINACKALTELSK